MVPSTVLCSSWRARRAVLASEGGQTVLSDTTTKPLRNMSTQLSTDLSWDKSSTRRFAPPGGKTSISLGGPEEDTPKPSKPVTPASPPPPRAAAKTAQSPPGDKSLVAKTPPAPPTIVPPPQPLTSSGLRVGVAVCESMVVRTAVVAALDRFGAEATVYEVLDPLQLPFAAQCLVSGAGVSAVVAIGSLTEAHWCSKEVAQSLVQSLLALGLEKAVPVVNGLAFQPVPKSTAPKLGDKLAAGAINLAAMNLGEGGSFQGINRLLSTADGIKSPTRSPPPGGVGRGVQGGHGPSVFETPKKMPQDVSTLMLGLRTSLKQHGAKGIFGLARKFRIADDDNSGQLDFHEFIKCMRELRMDWTEDEHKNVFEFFDEDSSGGISYEEFLVGVRGEMNERRAQLTLKAFALMDKDKSGALDLDDVRGVYDASAHPDVISGKRTEDDILGEFLATFETGEPDGKVTPEEWCRYYAMISASVDEDDYFELMMRNAWHMSGGEGQYANSSCRRVLATHADGAQTVEEIKDDLGIGPTDKPAMLANLRAQGLNVASIELFGSTDNTTPATAPPPATPTKEDRSNVSATTDAESYTPRVRQGPGGNSSLVLG